VTTVREDRSTRSPLRAAWAACARSRRPGTQVGVLGVLLAAAALSAWVSTGPAAASSVPRPGCSTSRGVVVAVDLAPWGGRLAWGCDPRLTTGLQALHVAGFTTGGDDQDGDAFVCRIDGYPPPAQEPCVTTPPASAYWSYWHADAGQRTWSYGQEGPLSYRPPAGSIDAWVFGSTDLAGTSGSPPFSPSGVRSLAARLPDGGPSGVAAGAPGSKAHDRPPGSEAGFVGGAVAVAGIGVAGTLLARRRRRLEAVD